jgi:hypothetical protein
VDVCHADAAGRVQGYSDSITAIARPRVGAGTPQAAEAVLIADIPQTARVSRSLAGPTVTYQGAPNFQPIASTSVSFAVNTDKDVFEVNNVYYLCYQGVWFIADAPAGRERHRRRAALRSIRFRRVRLRTT